MLPNNVIKYRILPPKDHKSKEFIALRNDLLEAGYSEDNINNLILTVEDTQKVLNDLMINKESVFYDFYQNGFEDPSPVDHFRDEIFGLSEILEAHKNQFWEEYPEIEKSYLQLSSIEGEYSYFYNKETDAMYGVNWDEMDDLVAGKLKPLFTSFYDFLEWYYSEESE